MLVRVEKIQGIGLFNDATPQKFSFRKATLIYAENGRGKSTFASILRSASSFDPQPIIARKTIDSGVSQKCVLQLNNGVKATFSGGAWAGARPDVLVFDADFVERNVYSGGVVSTNHRKNLLEFSLGESAVALREEVNKETTAAKSANDEVSAIEKRLAAYHPGMSLLAFQKLPTVENVDADAEIAEIRKRIIATSKIIAIQNKAVPSRVEEPVFEIDSLFGILESSLENIHNDSERLVKAQLSKFHDHDIESWVSRGVELQGGDECPYCGQPTSEVELISAYKTHFNKAYAELKRRVSILEHGVSKRTSVEIVDSIKSKIDAASAIASSWGEFIELPSITFDEETAKAAMAGLNALLMPLVKQKVQQPVEAINAAEVRREANIKWLDFIEMVRAANNVVDSVNRTISEYKLQLKKDDPLKLKSRIDELEISKKKNLAEVVELLNILKEKRESASEAEKKKKLAREKLDSLMTQTLDKYQKKINELLKKFGAAFSIENMSANFRGQNPRSEYGILIRNKPISLEGGAPSFSAAMSEGDKRTLAFAFFVASTINDSRLSSKIVLVDDPMCSLDSSRRLQTQLVLKQIFDGAGQLIVAAHDPYFIRDLRARLASGNLADVPVLKIAHVAGGYSDFELESIDEVCESPFFKRHRMISEFVGGIGVIDSMAVAKAIRPMLEGYLHRRFPGQIPGGLMFGNAVNLIRLAVAPSPLVYGQSLVAELDEINTYAGQFHHDTNPDADHVVIDDAELRAHAERALKVVYGA